ncbi:hypothetical protein HGO21_03445 [Acinetobacter sp. CUI P1]|nr:hypothetical protein [Acinetobacter sp. CUI P1]
MIETLDVIKNLLSSCSGGPLQKLSDEFLSKEYENDWVLPLKPFGLREGTTQTRKGTPDLWTKTKLGSHVFIQATGDKTRGKMLGDLKKSLRKLKEISELDDPQYVAFVNYNPDPEEVHECENLCKDNSIEFAYYDNVSIAKKLMETYTDLQAKYLSINAFWELGKVTEGNDTLKCMSCHREINVHSEAKDNGLFCSFAENSTKISGVFWVHEGNCLDNYKREFELPNLSIEPIRDYTIPTVFISRLMWVMRLIQSGVEIETAAYINLHNFYTFASNQVFRAPNEKEIQRMKEIYGE